MASLNDLKLILRKTAKISTDAASEIGDNLLTEWIESAVREHNTAYTVATVPANEIQLVMYLAWRSVCLWRAGKYANQENDRSGSGFQNDSLTPYKKNMEMYRELMKTYKEAVIALADNEGEGIVVGDLSIENTSFGGITPADVVVAPEAPLLTASGITATTVLLNWTANYDPHFQSYLVMISTTAGIYQAWNYDGINGVRYVSTDSELLTEITDHFRKTVKVTDLVPETTYYFVVGLRDTSGLVSFSNEVSVTTPA